MTGAFSFCTQCVFVVVWYAEQWLSSHNFTVVTVLHGGNGFFINLCVYCCFCAQPSRSPPWLCLSLLQDSEYKEACYLWNPCIPLLSSSGPAVCPARVQHSTAVTGSLLPEAVLEGVQKRSGVRVSMCAYVHARSLYGSKKSYLNPERLGNILSRAEPDLSNIRKLRPGFEWNWEMLDPTSSGPSRQRPEWSRLQSRLLFAITSCQNRTRLTWKQHSPLVADAWVWWCAAKSFI